MRGSRKKLRSKKINITRYLNDFNPGEKVHVKFSSSRIPHPKFHGLTGFVVKKRGRSFVVRVRNKKAWKEIVLRPEHLKK